MNVWIKSSSKRLQPDEMDSDILYRFFKSSNDPEGFMNTLDHLQQNALQKEIERSQMITSDRIGKELDALLAEIPGMNRKVSSSLRLRVSDWPHSGIAESKKKINSCNLFIWDPPEELIDKIREGIIYPSRRFTL